MRRAPLVALVGLCACPPPSSLDPNVLTSAQPDPSASSGIAVTGGGEGPAATAGTTDDWPATTGEPVATSGLTTSTSGATTTTTTTGFDPSEATTAIPNAPPEIWSLKATPPVIEQAGAVVLEIDASDDVTEATIKFGEVETMVAIEGSPTQVEFEVTSQEDCLSSQFEVTVFDVRGLSDSDTLALDCQMPQSGSEMYKAQLLGLNGSSATDVALLPDGGALVSGVKDERMAVWALDAEGQVKPGWPKTIDGWSLDPKFDALPSWAMTVARDSQGRIYVGGAVKEATGPRRYVARLNSQGFLMWEDPGVTPGEEVEGIAVTTDDVAVAVGSIRTTPQNQPAFYDMGIWGYPPTFPQAQAWSDVFAQPNTDPFVDKENTTSERGHDAAALPSGEVLVVGEREYKADQFTALPRATWQRYTSGGARIGASWTSTGFKFKHDAARSVTRTSEGYAIIGWGEHVKNSPERQVLVQRFDLTGKLLGVQHESSASFAQGEGISQDREKKLVVAATTLAGGIWDAWIFATIGADQPHPWEQIESKTVAAAIECDDWGACTWVGTTDLNGKSTAVASKRAP